MGTGRIPPPYLPKDHWEYNLYEYHKGLPDKSHYEFIANTPGVKTAEYWKEWCQAIFYAGTTLCMWNALPEVKAAFLSLCSFEPGMKVFLVGKYLWESGLADAVRSLVGDSGTLGILDMTDQVLETVRELGPRRTVQYEAAGATGSRAARPLVWPLTCFDGLPEGSLDRVVFFNGGAHVANWEHVASEISRVLGEHGRLVMAEAPLGGREFENALHLDSHYESFILRVLSGLGLSENELPYVDPRGLSELLRPHFAWTRWWSHRGILLLYGAKGKHGHEIAVPGPAASLPCSDEARGPVSAFLAVKPVTSSWELMTEREREIWGETVEDILTPHMGKCVTWGGGSLCWNYRNQREITDIMWSNLAAKPGDKVMVIGEFLHDLGTLEEVKRRVGPTGQVFPVDITASPCSYDYKGWQAKRKAYMDLGSPEEWPYDFADDFPDEFFDVLFLPQGVHHCNNWLRDAPRLLRAVKVGGQVMAIECGINRPEMALARDLSALVQVVGDRVFRIALPEWLVGPLSPEGPLPAGTGYGHEGRPYHDVPTAHLREAFGAGLTDVCSLEYKGWILFWGYKAPRTV
ncbi:MAG: hypothetical protein N3B14_05020 [Thermoleophilia bacterium]|nr:hypothetical protein [Thermoleophilia bacterium]